MNSNRRLRLPNKENEKIKGLNDTLKQAKDLEGAGNYDQAITILQQATHESIRNQDLVWAYLGDAQRGAKKYSDAAESYQKALAIKPTSGPYMSQLADAYAKSGQTDKAVQEYAAAAQADPTNAAAYYYNEGAVLTNTGKVDEAIAAFDKAIQIDPNRADAYYWKGVDLIGKATMGKTTRWSRPKERPRRLISIWSCSRPANTQTRPSRCSPRSAHPSRPATARRKHRRSSVCRLRGGEIRPKLLSRWANLGHFGHETFRCLPYISSSKIPVSTLRMTSKAEPALPTFLEARGTSSNTLRSCRPTDPEMLSLLEAVGLVLAEDLRADRDFPPFPRSTRDGFAVRAADIEAAAFSLAGALGRSGLAHRYRKARSA